MPRSAAILMLASLASLATLSPAIADPAGAGQAGAVKTSPDRAAQLERLVRQDCGSCHGMTLKGGLGPDITAQALSGAEREAITQIILDGVPGTPMPPWRPLLSEAEARWIAEYLLKDTAP